MSERELILTQLHIDSLQWKHLKPLKTTEINQKKKKSNSLEYQVGLLALSASYYLHEGCVRILASENMRRYDDNSSKKISLPGVSAIPS